MDNLGSGKHGSCNSFAILDACRRMDDTGGTLVNEFWITSERKIYIMIRKANKIWTKDPTTWKILPDFVFILSSDK